jgi:putative transposase
MLSSARPFPSIGHPDQVWAVDITYIRMRQGFMYLFVIIDLYSRYIVDYELSTTIDRELVLGCLKRAFRVKKPEIINSDQGSQFTSKDYIELLHTEGIKISSLLNNSRTTLALNSAV